MNSTFAESVAERAAPKCGAKGAVSTLPSGQAILRVSDQETTLIIREDIATGRIIIAPALGVLANYQQATDLMPYLEVILMNDIKDPASHVVAAICDIWDQSRLYLAELRKRKAATRTKLATRTTWLNRFAKISRGRVHYSRELPDFWYRSGKLTLSGEIDKSGMVHMYLTCAPEEIVDIFKAIFKEDK